MEVRSYYATTVEAAMEMARRELGSEALLIQSNRSGPEVAHLGRYEVVFAGELRLPASLLGAPAASRSPIPRVSGREAEPRPASPPIDLLPRKHDFSAILASAGVPSQTSRAFFDGKPKAGPSPISRLPSRFSGHDLACSPGLGRSGFTETAVAFVGPSGAGKTTTIMKLALMHGVLMSRPVRLFSFDPDRVGTALRLQRFAELLDLEFAHFDSLTELSAALNEPAAGLTFIDTIGYAKNERSALAEAAECLLNHSKIETQLVLRVDRKTSDSLAAVRLFSPFQSARLVLTGFDESSDNGDLTSVVETAELPVSFLGVGQRIPEDLEPARSERLAELILNGWPESARSAA